MVRITPFAVAIELVELQEFLHLVVVGLGIWVNHLLWVLRHGLYNCADNKVPCRS